MHQYKCWIRLNNGTTTHIVVSASMDCDVRPLVEGMHGPGSLLNYNRL